MERFITRPVLVFLAALCLALTVIAVTQTVRLTGEKAAHAKTKLATYETLAKINEKTRKAEVAAQRARDAYVTNTAENAVKHAQGVTDAFEKGLAAGRRILSGDVRLQEHWRGCPTPASGGNAADAAVDKALAQRRAESAGRIIGIGAAADNDYAALYREYLNTRELLSSCYAKKPSK